VRTDLLIRARRDPRLSLRARGVLATLIAYDEVIPADRVWKEAGGEGRDPVRRAYKELRDLGYIITKKVGVTGQWVTIQAFAPRIPVLGTTDAETGRRSV
jgi:hypothetical protein